LIHLLKHPSGIILRATIYEVSNLKGLLGHAEWGERYNDTVGRFELIVLEASHGFAVKTLGELAVVLETGEADVFCVGGRRNESYREAIGIGAGLALGLVRCEKSEDHQMTE
tara:strand:- start:324 stop:659 length:336 start_codon:yes stop_codon:yes gene_type:complete